MTEYIIYGVYDKDDNKIAEGSRQELAEKLHISISTITNCGSGVQKTLLGQYKVVKEGKGKVRRNAYMDAPIKELFEQGLNLTQIAEKLGSNPPTIRRHLMAMRERGEIA